jgi:hypothetical protein
MAAIAAKLQTTLPNSPARLASDLDNTYQAVPFNTTRYMLKAFSGPVSEVADSAVAFYPAMAVALTVAFHLGTGTEQSWTATGMQNVLDALLAPSWWRTIAGVFLVEANLPQVSLGDIVREGRVVHFSLTLELSVDPAA